MRDMYSKRIIKLQISILTKTMQPPMYLVQIYSSTVGTFVKCASYTITVSANNYLRVYQMFYYNCERLSHKDA
jgi:hypothetical protein